MKKSLLYTFLMFALAIAKAQNPTIIHDGIVRNYILHLPTGYNAANNYPLVFNLHGYTSQADQEMLYSAMNAVADTGNFIVCYPNGIANAWNSGFNGIYGTGVDDVGFISNLIDTLASLYSIDLTRVYSCGMSNGGYQSYRLACELSHRIAAIASITGLLTDSTAFYCNPPRAVPVMDAHGTADNTVNYNGFPTSLGVEETISFWVTHNGCVGAADTIAIPDVVTSDTATAEIIHYTNCEPGSEVKFYKVFNGGHTWPGAAFDLFGLGYGHTCYDFNASVEAWRFFSQYDLPSAVAVVEKQKDVVVQVFPNPANTYINIVSNERPDEIVVYDLNGKKLLETLAVSNQVTLNLALLIPGTYLLQIQQQESSVWQKLSVR